MTHLSRANASLLAGLAFFVLAPQASADSPDALPALGLSKDVTIKNKYNPKG